MPRGDWSRSASAPGSWRTRAVRGGATTRRSCRSSRRRTCTSCRTTGSSNADPTTRRSSPRPCSWAGQRGGGGRAAPRRKRSNAPPGRRTSAWPTAASERRPRGAEVELPEVEVMRRDLEKDVVGRKVAAAEVRPSKNAMRVIRRHAKRKEFTDRLIGRKFTKSERRGKYVLLNMDNGEVLVIHFGMSGLLARGNKRLPLAPHTHVVITFQQGGDLRYVDPRTFGEMFVATTDELGKIRELDHVAIDPLEDTFTWQEFSGELARRAAKLKPLLMDQKFISGLGNIYSDEVLFAAGLRYDRVSDSLSSQEVRRLYRAMREVLRDAVRFRGTTLDDEAYVDLFGKPGEFQSELKVYGRKGLPCRRCRTPTDSIKVNGRTSYFCPQCQS